MDKERFIGIVEADGCFTISFKKSTTGYKPQIQLYLAITQHNAESGLRKIMRFMEEEFDVHPRMQSNGYIYIDKLEDTIKIANFFKNVDFIFNKKAKQFNIWSEALDIIQRGDHRTISGIKDIWNLRNKIKQGKGRRRKELRHFFNADITPRNRKIFI